MITKDIYIEDLIKEIPNSANFLREKGLVCIKCGEPVWGTLEELAKQKKISEEELSSLVIELNRMIQ